MSDKSEQQLSTMTSQHHIDTRRRLSEIKIELQGLMRQKKKYDEEKLKQDSEFLQSEINAVRTSIADISKEISNQIQKKRRLYADMANLRSRSRLRYTNLASALRDKRQYEAELKKADKPEEYRELARAEIRSIEAALPILKEEDQYKADVKKAEDAQQTAVIKRKNLEESLNKNLRKLAENKQLLSENDEKLPKIEASIESLRAERERLLSSTAMSSVSGKKLRRRLLSNQQKLSDISRINPPTTVQSGTSLEDDYFEYEKYHCEDQLDKVNTLINYFREKLSEHGLKTEQLYRTSSELTSFLHQPVKSNEEQSLPTSYMNEGNSEEIISANPSATAVAMKLPRDFLQLNLNLPLTNEIIHSPCSDRNEFEYKKELSQDILDKYGGCSKNKQQSEKLGKKFRKHKKNFGISHVSQMVALYDNVRSSTNSTDALPSMPMYEYELLPVSQSLEFLKQSFESYLIELSNRRQHHLKSQNDDEQLSRAGFDYDYEDILDSAVDTFSETSSIIEPLNSFKQITNTNSQLTNIIETHSSTLSNDKKILDSSLLLDYDNLKQKNNQICLNTRVNELNSDLFPLSIQETKINRQISDEGYRSAQNEQHQHVTRRINNHNSPLLTRSISCDWTEKVDHWLSNTISTTLASSVPMSLNSNTQFQV